MFVCVCVCVPNSSSTVTSRDPPITSGKAGDLGRLHIDNYHGAGRAEAGGRPEGPKKEEEKIRGKLKAEERHVDSWARDGQDGRWTRVHRSARRALFTPFKVAGGPSAKTPLKRLRITRGKYLSSGRSFKIIDDWSVRANAHRA